MADLDQIITVQIDRNTTTPSQAGFGIPLLSGYFPTSIFAERVRTYTSLQGMVDDGFEAGDPLYIAASDLLAQNPSPPEFKIGRRVLAPQQVIEITPDAPVVGEVHTVTITGYADAVFGSRVVGTDTHELVIAAETDAEDIVDAFVAAFATPNGDFTAAKVGATTTATLTITADNTDVSNDGMLFGVVVSAVMKTEDLTTDPGLTTDMDAIELYDSDWYAWNVDSNSALEIASGAAWTETKNKLFLCQTADFEVADVAVGETTSIAAILALANYDRTALFFHRNNREYVCSAMLGRALPEDAGSITWAYKQLSSVSAQTLTATERTNCENKQVNFLTALAGVNVTRYGTVSGSEFIDIMRGSDWLAARIQERVYTLLVNNDKLPYTDAGIQSVRSEVLAQLQQGVSRGFIAATPEPTCTVPFAIDVSPADKGNRVLNDVFFRATLAGAIHKVAIEGELNL